MMQDSPPKRVNIRDVSARANVSISTVSRVLNDSGYVSEKTRRRVLRAVRELDYTQNLVARSLRTKQSHLIGLVVPDISNEFYSLLAKAIDERVLPAGFQLLLCNTREDEAKERSVIESLVVNHVSAMIVVSAGETIHELLVRSGVPTVMFDGNPSGTSARNIVFVDCDNYAGGRLAAQRLIDGGADRLAILRTYRPVIPMVARERGFRDAAAESGIPSDDISTYSVNISTAEAMNRIASVYERDRFTGLFCAADILGLGALTALRSLNVAVPSEVQVVGFDGIPLGNYTIPPLSTIAQDVDNTADVIAEEVLRLQSGSDAPRHVIVPVSFIERGSTRNTRNQPEGTGRGATT